MSLAAALADAIRAGDQGRALALLEQLCREFGAVVGAPALKVG